MGSIWKHIVRITDIDSGFSISLRFKNQEKNKLNFNSLKA
ncbi:hypothetical protein MNV_450007 [Candidatus Methanoperedens nitroreducens]|uniref:Uncharacterized protein n=1 Tax=Candidatus Methanoperedens nitratireducens TaxID=1392998 RepID=A0A284VR57_9EURY|nr:hypothetical protein MNV_450007 [Candidatus Methanoperedens nitroreducens]